MSLSRASLITAAPAFMEGSLAGRLLAQPGSDWDCWENERRKLARKNCMHAPSIYLWCNAQPCRHPLFRRRWQEFLDKRGYVLIDLRKSLFLAFFPNEIIFTHFSNAWFDSIQCFLPRCLGQKGPLIWEWFKCSTFHSFPLNPLVTFNRFHLHPVPNRPTMGGPCRISQRFDLRCNFSNWQPHHVTIMPPQRDIRQLFSATKMNFLWYFLSKWSFLLSWFRSEKLEKESAPQPF